MTMRRSREEVDLDLRSILAAQGEDIDNFQVSRQKAATLIRGLYGLPTIQLNNINVFPKSLRFAQDQKEEKERIRKADLKSSRESQEWGK